MLSALGEKIFVDRYALKEHNKFVINDRVLVKHLGQSVWGTVLSFKDDTVYVKLESGETIKCEKRSVEKPIETPERMFKRVAVAVAKAEENARKDSERMSPRGKWRKEFFHLLSNWKFIPGGRILSAAGAGGLCSCAEGFAHSDSTAGTAHDNLTFYNCFVLPSPKDSREGIINTLQQMVDIMSRGGGVGINISSLRPKDSPVIGVSGRSSGAVSWGALYSFATGLICQGGSRRGALCLVLNDWHPEVPLRPTPGASLGLRMCFRLFPQKGRKETSATQTFQSLSQMLSWKLLKRMQIGIWFSLILNILNMMHFGMVICSHGRKLGILSFP